MTSSDLLGKDMQPGVLQILDVLSAQCQVGQI